jgi:hypothetical protein
MYIEDDILTFGWCRSLKIRCLCGRQVCVCVELLAHLGDLLFGDGHEPTDHQLVTFFKKLNLLEAYLGAYPINIKHMGFHSLSP